MKDRRQRVNVGVVAKARDFGSDPGGVSSAGQPRAAPPQQLANWIEKRTGKEA
jgi:hypothetical protein